MSSDSSAAHANLGQILIDQENDQVIVDTFKTKLDAFLKSHSEELQTAKELCKEYLHNYDDITVQAFITKCEEYFILDELVDNHFKNMLRYQKEIIYSNINVTSFFKNANARKALYKDYFLDVVINYDVYKKKRTEEESKNKHSNRNNKATESYMEYDFNTNDYYIHFEKEFVIYDRVENDNDIKFDWVKIYQEYVPEEERVANGNEGLLLNILLITLLYYYINNRFAKSNVITNIIPTFKNSY